MLLLLGSLGAPEIMFILALALLIFGPKKLPELGRSLGKGLREFKKGTSGLMDSLNDEIQQPPRVEPRLAPPSPAPKSETEQASAKVKEPEQPKEEGEVVIDLEKEGK